MRKQSVGIFTERGNTMSQKRVFHRDRLLWLVCLVCAGVLAFKPGASAQNAEAAGTSTEPQASSAVPRLIKFSGEVKDASGKIATGAVNVVFSLYELQDGGSPLWSETQQVQLDAQGRYNILLGATQPDGLPLDLFISGQARWLGVQPALPGVGEQARILLVGVPYALKAADAETLGGKPASAFMLTASEPASQAQGLAQGAASVPSGSGAAGPQKVASSGRTPDKSGTPNAACATITADGTATANQVAKFTAACTIHQSLIFDNGTDVGIGTASPAFLLTVGSSANSSKAIFESTDNNHGTIQIGNPISNSEASISFISGVSSFGDNPTSVNGNNHKWGIGPGIFHIGGNAFGIGNDAFGGSMFTLQSTGFVGIGTTSPLATLDVNGTASVRANLNLPQAFNSTAGVINMGGNPFIHACCTAGSFDTFVGSGAGDFTTTGSVNTGIGHGALGLVTSGVQNTASGASALTFTNTGAGNTASGFSAMISNTTGSWNSALGAHTDVSSGNLTGATAIGAFARVAQSNALILGCTIGSCAGGALPPNVGIGTQTPSATLDVVAPNQLGVFVRGPESGVGAGLDLQTTGSGGLQWEILDTGSTSAQGPNKLNIRNVNTGNDVMTILASGAVGIGTRGPDNLLTVNGSADKPGGGSWGTFSDGRLKTVDGKYGGGLDAIMKLTPVRYRYKEQNAMGIKDGEEHVGFVAQEVEKAIPEAVTRNNSGYLLVNNDPILWTMLNAIKQQQAEIRTLTRSVHEKDAEIEKLAVKAQQLRKLQRQMAALEVRLAQVEAQNRDNLAAASVIEGGLTQ
jgi:trimeric autotransporter adhesin